MRSPSFCHALEPHLEQWVKQGDNVIFKRIYLPYQGANDPEAHLFLTLQAMGKSQSYRSAVLNTLGDIFMRKRSETLTEQEILDAGRELPGIYEAKFAHIWTCF